MGIVLVLERVIDGVNRLGRLVAPSKPSKVVDHPLEFLLEALHLIGQLCVHVQQLLHRELYVHVVLGLALALVLEALQVDYQDVGQAVETHLVLSQHVVSTLLALPSVLAV